MIFKHKFVEYIPDTIDVNTIYISISFSTAIHLCACGCGKEVVTPLSPTDWEITFNGKSISLYPSIGNWNFECKSHYWIRKSEILLAPKWTEIEIKENRKKDKKAKINFFYHSKETSNTNKVNKKSQNASNWPSLQKLFKRSGKSRK